ncbi:hypothetical protein Y1Q_0019499 [Alligator mississippiensis]|uniref:Uncharacterized protein n=1 Tax=Alligator mississippiensis TaxID=8496 RepID=A0A151NML1_ALLMI|nr:hypothetical protein Y1Q_0019499 [Alligator mississippiensis]
MRFCGGHQGPGRNSTLQVHHLASLPTFPSEALEIGYSQSSPHDLSGKVQVPEYKFFNERALEEDWPNPRASQKTTMIPTETYHNEDQTYQTLFTCQ